MKIWTVEIDNNHIAEEGVKMPLNINTRARTCGAAARNAFGWCIIKV